MTTHELAKKLLEGPNVLALVKGPTGDALFIISEIKPIMAHKSTGYDWMLYESDKHNTREENQEVVVLE